jgi:hypothetical protein
LGRVGMALERRDEDARKQSGKGRSNGKWYAHLVTVFQLSYCEEICRMCKGVGRKIQNKRAETPVNVG